MPLQLPPGLVIGKDGQPMVVGTIDIDISTELAHTLEQYFNDQSLDQKQLQKFFNRVNQLIAQSPQAKAELQQYYRNLASHELHRDTIRYYISQSDVGREILVEAANYLLASGGNDGYVEMFQTLTNFSDEPQRWAIDKAIEVLNSSTFSHNEVSAMNYLEKLKQDEVLTADYQDMTLDALHYEAESLICTRDPQRQPR